MKMNLTGWLFIVAGLMFAVLIGISCAKGSYILASDGNSYKHNPSYSCKNGYLYYQHTPYAPSQVIDTSGGAVTCKIIKE